MHSLSRRQHGLVARELIDSHCGEIGVPIAIDIGPCYGGWIGPEVAYILQDCEASAFVFHERYPPACEAAISEAGLPDERGFIVEGGAGVDGARPGYTT